MRLAAGASVWLYQRLSAARDEMVGESRRRNETERFYQLEMDNNKQLHARMKLVKRDLAVDKQHLDDVDQRCNDLASEVPCTASYSLRGTHS